jgi:hypothetical protein
MAYSTTEGRTQILEDMAAAADELGLALACLTEAYEALDEEAGDTLEARMFRPVQSSYGRLKRTYTEFAGRSRIPERPFASPSAGTHSGDPKVYIERAVEAAEEAEQRIAELQDSMLPVDVGDAELRAGLSETRSLVADVPAEGRRLLRTFGR